MDLIVLKPQDQDAILQYERLRSEREISDPVERELLSWKARWRGEQLTHYLSLGWSYAAFGESKLIGYILTQPLLFFRGMTQTMWVEHIAYDRAEIGAALLEAVYKWARDKHFQTILISEMPADLKFERTLSPIKDHILEAASSRWM